MTTRFIEPKIGIVFNDLASAGVERDIAHFSDEIADVFEDLYQRKLVLHQDHDTAFALAIAAVSCSFAHALGEFIWMKEADIGAVDGALLIVDDIAHREYNESVANEDEQVANDQAVN